MSGQWGGLRTGQMEELRGLQSAVQSNQRPVASGAPQGQYKTLECLSSLLKVENLEADTPEGYAGHSARPGKDGEVGGEGPKEVQ